MVASVGVGVPVVVVTELVAILKQLRVCVLVALDEVMDQILAVLVHQFYLFAILFLNAWLATILHVCL